MENVLEKSTTEVPIETPITTELECKTPISPVQVQIQQAQHSYHESSNELRKPVTPDRLRVPKAFKYPERYTSPTDMIISPVTKGLQARNKKGSGVMLLQHGKYQSKVPELCLQDISPLQNKLPMMNLIDEKIKST